jgi:hypothetical protein
MAFVTYKHLYNVKIGIYVGIHTGHKVKAPAQEFVNFLTLVVKFKI